LLSSWQCGTQTPTLLIRFSTCNQEESLN
jgi:hypothetical protein